MMKCSDLSFKREWKDLASSKDACGQNLYHVKTDLRVVSAKMLATLLVSLMLKYKFF